MELSAPHPGSTGWTMRLTTLELTRIFDMSRAINPGDDSEEHVSVALVGPATRRWVIEGAFTLGWIETAGGHAVALAGDVRDESFAQALVALARSRFGGLDIAFNNAGALGALGPTPEVSLEAWREAVDVNLTGAFLGAKHQLPALRERGGGALIFTSTFVGHTAGFPGTACYAASKSGLIGLTQALAVEAAADGIRVNALLPGGTDTPMAREMNGTAEQMAAVARLHALGRIASPEEIARAALFLASPASSFMTGTAMLVDGGVSIKKG